MCKRVFQSLCEFGIEIECFCDSDENKIGETIFDKKIISLETLVNGCSNVKILITIENKTIQNMIANKICAVFQNKDFMQDVVSNREYCKEFHLNSMDVYFDNAETDYFLSYFWGENTIFYNLFQTLNLENILELACGRGRHVQKYIDKANHIILVDILEKNIDHCKNRFQGIEKINYYQNNGFDLANVEDNSCSSLFTYDAMVHFESLDVYQYLLETYRVLKKGGKALFHHSNNHLDYRASFATGKIGRAFMSKDMFAHFCYKAGLTVLEQHVIDWGIVGYEDVVKDLDCITLVEKQFGGIK